MEISTLLDMPRSSGIYKIVCNTSQKVYIGSSVNMNRRLQNHRAALRNNRHINKHLQAAWNEYGEEPFTVFVLESCDIDALKYREAYWISKYEACDNSKGYNIALDTSSPMRGRKHTDEQRRKISTANRGLKRSAESRQRLGNARRGTKHTSHAVEKITNAARKYYSVVDPAGNKYSVHGLKRFCREHGLNYHGMCALASGARPSYKGWACQRITS